MTNWPNSARARTFTVAFASPIQTSELSAPRQESVTGHKLRSQDDATSLIEDIETREGL